MERSIANYDGRQYPASLFNIDLPATAGSAGYTKNMGAKSNKFFFTQLDEMP